MRRGGKTLLISEINTYPEKAVQTVISRNARVIVAAQRKSVENIFTVFHCIAGRKARPATDAGTFMENDPSLATTASWRVPFVFRGDIPFCLTRLIQLYQRLSIFPMMVD